MTELHLTGFGNHHQSEALKGALPLNQNSPQKAPHGLYAEQLSGTSFLVPRSHNLKSWLYRIYPSAKHAPFTEVQQSKIQTAPMAHKIATPNQLRWNPLPYPEAKTDFIDGLVTFAVNGNAEMQLGLGIHHYSINASMKNRFFQCSDGDFLIVPQEGSLEIPTEFGTLRVQPGSIALIPRGVKFQVNLLEDKKARGYVCENYGQPFRIPDLGPIGAKE